MSIQQVCLLRKTRDSRGLVTVLFDWKCMGRQLRPRHATVDDIRSWQTKENPCLVRVLNM